MILTKKPWGAKDPHQLFVAFIILTVFLGTTLFIIRQSYAQLFYKRVVVAPVTSMQEVVYTDKLSDGSDGSSTTQVNFKIKYNFNGKNIETDAENANAEMVLKLQQDKPVVVLVNPSNPTSFVYETNFTVGIPIILLWCISFITLWSLQQIKRHIFLKRMTKDLEKYYTNHVLSKAYKVIE